VNSTRREVLTRLSYAFGILPYLAFAPRSLFGTLLFEPTGLLVPPKPLPANPFMRDGKALVAMVHGHDMSAMLQEGLRQLGGLEQLRMAGKRIVLKPNVVNDRPPPSTTSPALIRVAVQGAKERGAAEVIVADSSGMLRFPTSENLSSTGIRAAAESARARVLALENEPWVRVEPSQATVLRKFYVSKPVYEADLFINLPVIKTHRFAHYSCSLKNLVGIVHPRNRPSLSVLSGNWHERIAELNLAVHPHLTIADGTTMMIAGGPTTGTPAQANLLLLSGDRIALDAVAMALIRSFGSWPKVMAGSLWSQRQIRRAIELGLGIHGPDAMELVTTSVSGTDTAFERRVQTVRRDLERV
jgi:uncharacterized protein (DUF362 family)